MDQLSCKKRVTWASPRFDMYNIGWFPFSFSIKPIFKYVSLMYFFPGYQDRFSNFIYVVKHWLKLLDHDNTDTEMQNTPCLNIFAPYLQFNLSNTSILMKAWGLHVSYSMRFQHLLF